MAGRIFVTGDTHGSHDIHKLNTRNFSEGKDLDKGDYVVICGDFGMPWANDGEDRYWLNWLESKPWTTLFICGNHENFDLLEAMPVERWHGGNVHFIRPSIIHLMRAQVFDIAGKSFFTMGGATSIDRAFRTPGVSWWPQELPSFDEREAARHVIAAHGGNFDYVITHCAPSNMLHALEPTFSHDELNRFFFEVERGMTYGRWFFGHYHVDVDLDDKGYRASCLQDRVIELGSPR